MQGYKQLTSEEREKLAELKQSGLSLGKISVEMGRSKSTISRELKRNTSDSGHYWPDKAQKKADERRQRGCRLDKDAALQAFVIRKIREEHWTPSQVSGWLSRGLENLRYVCYETIYSWIYKFGQKDLKLWKSLPRHKAKRGLRKCRGAGVSRIPNRVSIHDRPKQIEKRQEFGHFEGDLMSCQKNSQHVAVVQERKSRYILAFLPSQKTTSETITGVKDVLKYLPKSALKSITFDNGGEFAGHSQLRETLGLETFFCDPYSSWQKGGIENANGGLRRDLPRSTNLKKMQKEDFDEIIENYNLTPRKCLKWKTPLEVFYQNLIRCCS